MPLSFRLLATHGEARRGQLATPHGVVETPCFMPVGTLGAVKGMPPQDLESAGAQVMLANLYHLSIRPGIERLEGLGGIHRFTSWNRTLLTDSGGFQVFSLQGLRTVDEGGVSFRNHIDGGLLRFTPESVVDAQRRIGVDIAMVLDECPPWPVDLKVASDSLDRTIRWAGRAREEWARSPGPGGLFAIIQGSVFSDLRRRSVEQSAEFDFDGYAIGGVSVGEPTAERRSVVRTTAPYLPADRPRYLMGVGTPLDILDAVQAGIDLFDCVLPARNARHGNLFTRNGVLRIKNARYADDPRPLDDACQCSTCKRVSRAFLHHLTRTGEVTAKVLATAHNIRFYLDFMADLREATASGTLAEYAASVSSRLGQGEIPGKVAVEPQRTVSPPTSPADALP